MFLYFHRIDASEWLRLGYFANSMAVWSNMMIKWNLVFLCCKKHKLESPHRIVQLLNAT